MGFLEIDKEKLDEAIEANSEDEGEGGESSAENH